MLFFLAYFTFDSPCSFHDCSEIALSDLWSSAASGWRKIVQRQGLIESGPFVWFISTCWLCCNEDLFCCLDRVLHPTYVKNNFNTEKQRCKLFRWEWNKSFSNCPRKKLRYGIQFWKYKIFLVCYPGYINICCRGLFFRVFRTFKTIFFYFIWNI